MHKRFASVLLFLISLSATAQQYTLHGRYPSTLGFRLFNDGGETYAFFAAAKYPDRITYRKIHLGPNLVPLDSIDYDVPGKAWLRGFGGDKNSNYFAFSINEPRQALTFIVTDKKGDIKYSLTKTKKELFPVLHIRNNILYYNINPLAFVDDRLLIVQVPVFRSSHLVAFDMSDGSIAWHVDMPTIFNVQQTDSLLIGLSLTYNNNHDITSIHFVNKFTGVKINEIALNPKRHDFRQIGAAASNGKNFIIAGEEYTNAKRKHSRFFLESYDLLGRQVFEKVDSVDRLDNYRIMVMGSAFDQEGNLVMMGQAYKQESGKKAAVATVGILTGGIALIPLKEEAKIEFITSTVCSPETGEILKFRAFPVGPWRYFSEFHSYGSYVMMKVLTKTVFFNVNTPEIPPIQFTDIGMMQSLHITPFGPVATKYQGMNSVLLKMVPREK